MMIPATSIERLSHHSEEQFVSELIQFNETLNMMCTLPVSRALGNSQPQEAIHDLLCVWLLRSQIRSQVCAFGWLRCLQLGPWVLE